MKTTGTSFRPYRIEITGKLILVSPNHLGSGDAFSLETDAPILRAPDGCPYLPGSSVRGILRDHLRREAGLIGCKAEHVKSLFGWAPQKNTRSGGALGRLTVCDCFSVGRAGEAPESCTELRDHVGIEPEWGAARYGAQFDMEALLTESSDAFLLHLIYEGDGHHDPEYRLLCEAVRFLESGRARIGAKSGWGFGHMQLRDLKTIQFDRGTEEGLLEYLKYRSGSTVSPSTLPAPGYLTPPCDCEHPPWAWLDLHLELKFEGPVLIKASLPPVETVRRLAQDNRSPAARARDRSAYQLEGEATADMVFIKKSDDDSYYLPGSSIRGVLRSRASMICNTFCTSSKGSLVDLLFGSIKEGKGGGKTLIEVEDAALSGHGIAPVFFDHVAIDRIVNCAEDKAKFSSSALVSPVFRPRISIRLTNKPEHRAALALWGFLLRDLLEGRLWMGHGTSRGYGYLAEASILECVFDTPSPFGFGSPRGWSASERSGRMEVRSPEGASLGIGGLKWIWTRVMGDWITSLVSEEQHEHAAGMEPVSAESDKG